MNESPWSEFRRTLMIGLPIVVVVSAFNFGGRAFAVRLGYSGELGFHVATVLFLLLVMAWALRVMYPQQGRPLLYRTLSGAVMMFGLLGINRTASRIRFDQWTILLVSLHVLMAIVLVLQFGWVVRRYPPPVLKPSKKTMGDWSD